MKTRAMWPGRIEIAAWAAVVFLVSWGWGQPANAWPTSTHAFVGESTCENCHDSGHEALKDMVGPGGKTGVNPVDVWQNDPHHGAYDKLTSDWGKQAAAKAGVSDPQAEGSMCLNCHATGAGGSSPPDASEAVSCEACHGAAADYVDKTKHGMIGNDPAKMAAAVAAGLIDVRKVDVRTQNCQGCHVTDTSKRPCYRATEKPFDVKRDEQFRHWRNNVPAI